MKNTEMRSWGEIDDRDTVEDSRDADSPQHIAEGSSSDTFNETYHEIKAVDSDTTVRANGRPTSYHKSFSDMDMLMDMRKFLAQKPLIPMLQRKGSIKGTQTFSRFNREFYFPKNRADEFEKMVLSWVMATLLSLVVVTAGLFIDFGVIGTSMTVYGLSEHLIIQNYGETLPPGALATAFIAFALTCAFFASLAGCMVIYCSPLAEGSGIPDVKSYLNGVHLKGLFTVPTVIAKSVGCAFAIGSGLIAGREGPIIHVGAILGAALSQGSSNTFKFRLPNTLVKHFRSAEWKRDFAVMGSAFGVATAFLAPMGGVLFAIEEGATVWRQQLTFMSLYGAVMTAFITSIIKGYIYDDSHSPHIPGVLFGSYRDSASDIVFDGADFPYVALVGVIGGLVGALFAWAQRYMIDFRKKYIRVSKVRTIAEIIFISLLLSSFRFWVPYIWGKCISSAEYHETQIDAHSFEGTPDAVPFNCPSHHVNDLGLLFWVPQEKMLKWVLHAEHYDSIPIGFLFAGFAFYLIFATLVFGIAVPSGLFIPSFIIGSLFGRIVGLLAAYRTGHYALISSYAFLGSAAALGGITRVTISVALIALESTQNFNTSLYCFMVVLLAKLIADSFNVGIYDLVIEKKNIPFVVDDVGYEGYQLTMDEVMTPITPSTSVHNDPYHHNTAISHKKKSLKDSKHDTGAMATVEVIDTLENILDTLESNPNAFEFLVDNDSGGLEGTIERLIILRLLENRLFGVNAPLLHPSTVDSAWPNLRNHLSQAGEAKMRKTLEGEFKTKDQVIDLRPYIDREPAIVLATSSMRKAHAHIRHGERNVLVAAPGSVNIIGVVKRHDIMPGSLEMTLHAKMKQQEKERKMLSKTVAKTDMNTTDVACELVPQETSHATSGSAENGPEWKGYDSDCAEERSASSSQSHDSDNDIDETDSTVEMKLDPFEPRFYSLLWEYVRHSDDRKKTREAKKNNRPVSDRYVMSSKPSRYNDLYYES